MTPGNSIASAIHRPSSSRSSSMERITGKVYTGSCGVQAVPFFPFSVHDAHPCPSFPWTSRTGILYATVGEANAMPVETTYTSLRERLASVLDQGVNDQEVVIVRRRGAKDVALVPAEELTSLTG